MPPPVTISRQAWKPRTVPAIRAPNPPKMLYAATATPVAQANPTAGPVGTSPQRREHNAERDQRDCGELGGADGFTQRDESRDRCQYRRDATCERDGPCSNHRGRRNEEA